MIKFDWISFVKKISIFFIIVVCIILIQKYINNQVSIQIQIIQEAHEKEKADIKLELEQKRLEETSKLEKQIIELKNQLEKAKILLEKIEQQKTYTSMIKKDVKKFMLEFDNTFGVKGKKDDK